MINHEKVWVLLIDKYYNKYIECYSVVLLKGASIVSLVVWYIPLKKSVPVIFFLPIELPKFTCRLL